MRKTSHLVREKKVYTSLIVTCNENPSMSWFYLALVIPIESAVKRIIAVGVLQVVKDSRLSVGMEGPMYSVLEQCRNRDIGGQTQFLHDFCVIRDIFTLVRNGPSHGGEAEGSSIQGFALGFQNSTQVFDEISEVEDAPYRG